MSAPAMVSETRPCVASDIGITYNADAPRWIVDAIDGYLAHFDSPRESYRCSCGVSLGGFLGSFTWGLVNGEGFCSACQRPARALHRILDASGEELASFGPLILLYALIPEGDSSGSGQRSEGDA